MKKENKEIRTFDCTLQRAAEREDKKNVIVGYAAVFNSDSIDLGGFIERINSGAFDGVIEISDVFCVLNHDNRRGILGRSRMGKGTLKLSVDENGLRYETELPNTELANEIMQYIERGEISQSSFAFTVKEETWIENEDGTYLRIINKIDRLFDVSPVYEPAYPDTSVAQRGLENFKSEMEAKAEEQRKAEEEKAANEIIKYYNNKKQIINQL